MKISILLFVFISNLMYSPALTSNNIPYNDALKCQLKCPEGFDYNKDVIHDITDAYNIIVYDVYNAYDDVKMYLMMIIVMWCVLSKIFNIIQFIMHTNTRMIQSNDEK